MEVKYRAWKELDRRLDDDLNMEMECFKVLHEQHLKKED